MKKTILAWLLLCLLLVSCGSLSGKPSAPVSEPPLSPATTPSSESTPSPEVAQHGTASAVRSYPLSIPWCQGFTVMGEGILVFSDTDTGTQLTLLTGDTMAPAAEKTLDIRLYDQIASIRADEEGLSYFDETTRETVILDELLREVTRIRAPEDMTGFPLLSHDRKTLYYSTPDAICALDLETRLPRVLRQGTDPELTLNGIHMDGTVLQCSRYDGGWETLFLSAENGQLLEKQNCWHDFASNGQKYITSFHRDDLNHLLFGTAGEKAKILCLTERADERILLEKSFGILSITSYDGIRMDYYDLSSGRLASTLTLEGDCFPIVRDGGNGILWLLVSDPMGEVYTLHRWDTGDLPSGDSAVYTDTWYPRRSPDLEGIARCQALAWDLGQKYGLEILVWEDAVTAQPWDYRFTEEHLVPLLEDQLARLDQQLSHFPEGFFEALSEDISGLTICIVRQVQGDTDYRSLENAGGLQYWIDGHACIALSTVNSSEGSLYHELCHVMDTRIIAQSNAYDQWEELNPSGFEYDYDYTLNASRNAGEYLRDAERCFIDTYSMSFPKEDRARILEYAMTEGNEHYFQSKTMQDKLYQVCIGIREAFGLKKSKETFRWEQYLQESLAYGK